MCSEKKTINRLYFLTIGYYEFHRELLQPEYGDSKQGQQRGGRKQINKGNKECLNVSLFFYFLFDFVLYEEILTRTDIATNQIVINAAFKTCN